MTDYQSVKTNRTPVFLM